MTWQRSPSSLAEGLGPYHGFQSCRSEFCPVHFSFWIESKTNHLWTNSNNKMLFILHLRARSTNIIGVLLNFSFIHCSRLKLWRSVFVFVFYRAPNGEKEHRRVPICLRGREPEVPAAAAHPVGRSCEDSARPHGRKGDRKPPVTSTGRPWVFSSLLWIPIPRIAATFQM